MALKFSEILLEKLRGLGKPAYETPQNAKQAIANVPSAFVDVLRQAGQGTARGLYAAGQTIDTARGERVPDFVPQSRGERAIFGEGAISPGQRNVVESDLEQSGLSPKLSKGLSSVALLGNVITDIAPGGKGIKQGGKAVLQNVAESTVKKPNAFVKVLRSVADPFTENLKVVRSQGKAGEALADTIRNTYGNAEVQAGKVINSVIKPFKKLTQSEKDNFVQFVQGQAEPMSPAVKQVGALYDQARKDVAGQADNLGLFEYGPRTNYLPRVIKEDYLLDRKNEKSIIDHLVTSGQATDEGDARITLKTVQDNIEGNNREHFLDGGHLVQRFGNLEKSRTIDLPTEAYESDTVNALTKYFERAYERIGEAESFGKDGERVPDLINAITAEGYDGRKAAAILGQVLNPGQPGILPKEITQPLMNVQSALKLTTAFVSNAGQPVNTITSKGLSNTLRGLGRIITDRDEALSTYIKSGAGSDSLLREATNSKYKNWVSKLPWMKTFGKVEDFNRLLDANASEFALRSMVNRVVKNPKSKVARRLLERQYGVNPDDVVAQGGLEGDAFLRAINESVNRSQFRTRAQDLPQLLSHPDAKLFTQFKTFAYKQAQFVMDEVVKEAAQGNPGPLIRYVIAGAVIGEGVQDAKKLIRGDKEERPTGFKRIVENVSATGGAGIIADAVTKLNRGKLSAYEWAFGPTASDLLNFGSRAVQGDFEAIAKNALRSVPYAGDALSEAVYPASSGGSSSKSSSSEAPVRNSPSDGSSGRVPKPIRN